MPPPAPDAPHAMTDLRPDPDALLARVQAEAARACRGRLKIFFGAAAGVGKTCAMLEEMTLKCRCYQETKRETWELGGAEITIDTWPWIPTFVEVEARDEKTLWATASKLGLDKKDALHGSVENIYQKYYNVTEEAVDNCQKMTFNQSPPFNKLGG
jgi:hypothetical protein